MLARTLIVAAAFGFTAGAARADDKEALQGTWVATSLEAGGMKLPADAVEKMKMTLVFKEDKVTSSSEGAEADTDKYEIDADKKTIDIHDTKSKKIVKGIYKLEGETLKLCMGEPGSDRPTEFVSKEGSSVAVIVLKKKG